jgi:hypothetical protein
MDELTTEETAETPTQESDPTPADLPAQVESESETFTLDYVKQLRDEAAANRVKAKRTDEANVRLVQALAAADGRLIEASELAYSEALTDDDGIVTGEKVSAAIDALIASKPYLSSRRPTVPIVQGVQPQIPDAPGLFTLIRERS